MPVLSGGPGGLTLAVRVIPRAGVTKIAGVRQERLLVRLAAPPVDGAANDALLAFFSKILSIPSRNITIATGHQRRDKRIVLSGITRPDAEQRLGLPGSG
jgi:uncharacterized protein